MALGPFPTGIVATDVLAAVLMTETVPSSKFVTWPNGAATAWLPDNTTAIKQKLIPCRTAAKPPPAALFAALILIILFPAFLLCFADPRVPSCQYATWAAKTRNQLSTFCSEVDGQSCGHRLREFAMTKTMPGGHLR
jgi:hypothetical protein